MPKKHKKILLVLSCAFIAYFSSEAVLRRAAVAMIDKDKVKLENVLGRLPGGIRDSISRKVDYESLKDSLARAQTDGERALILTNMAATQFHDDEKRRLELFADIVDRYPGCPESTLAFSSLLMNESVLKPVSARQFHSFVAGLPPYERCRVWQEGLSSLKGRDKKPDEIFEFLSPIMELKPDYREYSSLYESLYNLALDLGRTEMGPAIEDKRFECADLPSASDAKIKADKAKGGRR